MSKLFAIMFLLFIASCASSPKYVPTDSSHLGPSVTSETDCVALGGEWRLHGISVSEVCVVPTPDGGKACRDTADCRGTCQAPLGTKAGQRVVGACATIFRPACSQRVSHGVAQARICE